MNIEKLIDTAISAALKAGEKILDVYYSDNFEVVSKEDLSPLTRADREAHGQIAQILTSTEIPLLSEEGIHTNYQERKNWEYLWLVDPLDGTKEFIKRNDEFTVNIALVQNNKPIAGVLLVPVTQTLYVGIIGKGAYKMVHPTTGCTFELMQQSGEKLPVITEFSEYIVATSRSHMNAATEQYIDMLRTEHPNVRMTAVGSALKLAMIAEGSVNIYPKIGPTMEWDTAAGHAILKASGKNVFLHDLETELVYNKENLVNPNFVAR